MCGITYGEILTAAGLSELAYLPAEAAMVSARRLGFATLRSVEQDGTFAVLCQGSGVTWIAFRGTQVTDWADINADRKFLPRFQTRGLAHRGFSSAIEQFYPLLFEAMEGVTGRVVCTGHSLGGALAVLCARRLGSERRIRRIDKPDLVTFGQPLVGSREFNRDLVRVTNDVVRVTNGNDPIPWLFFWPIYQHATSSRIHLTGDGDVLIQPTRWELLKNLECGRAKGVVRFLSHLCRTRSLFRAWLQVTSVLDHKMSRYRSQLESIFEGRAHEYLD